MAFLRTILLIFIFAGSVVAGGGYFFLRQHYHGASGLPSDANVLIERGTSIQGIAKQLEADGVIDNALLFTLSYRLFDGNIALQAGEYVFSPHTSPQEVVEKLGSGDVVIRKFTVPEGLSSKQVATLLGTIEGLDGEVPKAPAEGSLMPDTYHFMLGDTRADKIARMQAAMQEFLAESWQKRDADLPLNSPEEALILASIVEKETGVPEERGRVAAVFINRLRKNMPLQTDPTVLYAITDGSYALERPLLRKDLQVDHPYNTYKNAGLPPGPIANPGRDSILAVLHPPTTNELYFVATGNGGHAFSRTLKEHNANVAKLRKVQREKKVKAE